MVISFHDRHVLMENCYFSRVFSEHGFKNEAGSLPPFLLFPTQEINTVEVFYL